MFRYTLLILLCLAGNSTAAQTLPDSTIELPEAVVEGESDKPFSTSRLGRIDGRTLASAPNGSVADAIARTGDVYVQRYGPTGTATASFRGAGARNTAVYLDGLLLSDPQSNEIDLTIIPLVMIESIDVRYGAGSAAAASGSMGGSIFLKTFKPRGQALKISGEGGAYGRMRLGANAGTSIGRFRLAAAGEISDFNGEYPYTNSTLIGSPEHTREGADKSLTALFASAEYAVDRHRISASGWLNSTERGLPGPANAPPAGARQWDDQARGWLKSHHNLEKWTVDLSAAANTSSLRYVNAATGSNDTTVTHSLAFAADAERVVGSDFLISVGMKAGPDWSDDVSEWRFSMSSEAMWKRGRLFVLPSVTFQSRSSQANPVRVLVPRLGLALRLDDAGGLLLKANAGRSFRMPSFLERFWVPGGNPSLEPEDGWSVDAGLSSSSGGDHPIEFQTTVFFAKLDNQIAWFPSFVSTGLQLWTPYNVGSTDAFGLEYSASATRRIGQMKMQVGLSGLLNRTMDRSDPEAASYNKQLRYTPMVTTGLVVSGELAQFYVSLNGRHVGRRYVTSDESSTIDGFTVVDAQVAYTLSIPHTDSRIALQVENALNANYSVIRLYPMPPRLVSIRLDVEIQ